MTYPLIGRLARAEAVKGNGIGEVILMDALRRSCEQSKVVASWAIIAEAKDARAKAFYERYGFKLLSQKPLKLFLPMATAAKLFP